MSAIDHGDTEAFTKDVVAEPQVRAEGVVEGGADHVRSHAERGACERVFSLPKNKFTDAQITCLGGMLQGSLMLRHNKRKM